MILSYSHLSITCASPEEHARVREFLADVTPFDDYGDRLIYMPLESEDAVPVSVAIEDVICFLEDHTDKLAKVSKKFDCKLELVAKSPLPYDLAKCDPYIFDFAKQIDAKIKILAKKNQSSCSSCESGKH